MAYTVWGAFDAYRKNTVDLFASDVTSARASRDFLFRQIQALEDRVPGFPVLYGSMIPYGSFARRTKKRPLDDVDILLLLNGRHTVSGPSNSDPFEYWLRIDDRSAPLAAFPDNHGYVNSTRVLNKIRDSLETVSQYSKSDIKKNKQAVTLNLKTYTWSFDIVPAVPIGPSSSAVEYYLIPDGSGDWMRTDPRIDATNATTLNGRHFSNFLPLVRILKAWNERGTKPRLSSYHLETLALNAFARAPAMRSLQEGAKHFFDVCQSTVTSTCPDPKRLGRNLDEAVSWDTKWKVAQAMKEASKEALMGIYYEGRDDHRSAIAHWQKVFGPVFPAYG